MTRTSAFLFSFSLRLIFACSLFMIILQPASSLATSTTARRNDAGPVWLDYTSQSGLFKVRSPEKYKASYSSFVVEDQHLLGSEEFSAILPQQKDGIPRTCILKLDQTLGPAMSQGEIAWMINRDLQTYDNYYKNLGGVTGYQPQQTHVDRDKRLLIYTSGEINIAYDDPKLGPQAMRVRVLMNGDTRLHQIVSGPKGFPDSYQARDFLDTLVFRPNLKKSKENFLGHWQPLESPTGMFSVIYPQKMAPPYYTILPAVKWDENTEKVSLNFYDPVRDERIFFNVYGYKFKANLNAPGQKEVLMKRHIEQHLKPGIEINLNAGTDPIRKKPYMEASILIQAQEGYPYIKDVKIRSYISGPYMVVQEVMTSPELQEAELVKNLTRYLDFTPEQIHAPRQPEIKSDPAITAQPAAPASP